MITFTKTQIEMLEHRLEIPDAIIEVHQDFVPFVKLGITDDDIETAMENVGAMIHKRTQRNEWGLVEWEILQDCVDGCTFTWLLKDAVDTGETRNGKPITQQMYNGVINSFNAMVFKLENLGMKNITYR